MQPRLKKYVAVVSFLDEDCLVATNEIEVTAFDEEDALIHAGFHGDVVHSVKEVGLMPKNFEALFS